MNTEINQLIRDHYGFIIKATSDSLNRYVNVHNDDAFSIALQAFEEAWQKYDQDKGPFLAYAKLVIRGRLIDHVRREQKHTEALSLDHLREEGVQVSDPSQNHQADYSLELKHWIVMIKEECHLLLVWIRSAPFYFLPFLSWAAYY